jgi:hypothetical protein
MMPIIGVKCDKFVTKSQAPTTPTVYPPLVCYSESDTIPEKISISCGVGKVYYLIPILLE